MGGRRRRRREERGAGERGVSEACMLARMMPRGRQIMAPILCLSSLDHCKRFRPSTFRFCTFLSHSPHHPHSRMHPHPHSPLPLNSPPPPLHPHKSPHPTPHHRQPHITLPSNPQPTTHHLSPLPHCTGFHP